MLVEGGKHKFSVNFGGGLLFGGAHGFFCTDSRTQTHQLLVRVVLEFLLAAGEGEAGNVVASSKQLPGFGLMAFGTVATSDVDTPAALASRVDILARPMSIAKVLECVI